MRLSFLEGRFATAYMHSYINYSHFQTDAFVVTSLHSMNSMQAIPLLIVNQL